MIKTFFLGFLSLVLLVPAPVYSNNNAKPAKNEQLPFKLLATILDSDASQATCVMMNLDDNKQAIYKIGDKVFDYQIAMITRGSVTLSKDGEFLFFNLPLGDENKPENVDSSAIKIKRSFIQKRIADLNSLLNQVSPVPFIESGKVIGLMVPPLNNKVLQYLLQKTGLKEGDVATSVNGESIDSLQKALNLYHKLKKQEMLEVEIKRGDSIKNLTYYIK